MPDETQRQRQGKARDAQQTRCAIYTRKSTEEGLQQEFNSLDAQREAGEAYIASQQLEGWVCLPNRYDDGGFTGANMERPAIKRLFEDTEAGRIDCVVVYKVDRLSRSLMDFARMMESFEKYRVSFVSVTQQFNTTHSMGRLTLNILLSFAQFEREIISERTRDKIAAARRKGKWSGGMQFLGYDVAHGSKLIVNATEAERVRAIFDEYLQRQSLTQTPDPDCDAADASASSRVFPGRLRNRSDSHNNWINFWGAGHSCCPLLKSDEQGPWNVRLTVFSTDYVSSGT